MILFRRGLIFAILLTVVSCAGCLFEPRDPELPGTNTIDYLPPLSTDNVLGNLERALAGGDPSGYERMLSDDFVFVPDSGALSNYPDVDWDGWGKDQEVAWVGSFLGNVESVTADLQAEEFGDEPGTSSAELRYVYALTVTEIGDSQVLYRAQATLEFHIDGTEWRLTRWTDEQGETDPDSGALLPSLGQRRGAYAASGGS